MNARRIVTAVSAASVVLVIAACDITKLLPGPTTPTPPTFGSDSKLIGRFTFGGSAPSATGLKAKFRAAGESVKSDSDTATVDSQGYFSFTAAAITSGSPSAISLAVSPRSPCSFCHAAPETP